MKKWQWARVIRESRKRQDSYETMGFSRIKTVTSS